MLRMSFSDCSSPTPLCRMTLCSMSAVFSRVIVARGEADTHPPARFISRPACAIARGAAQSTEVSGVADSFTPLFRAFVGLFRQAAGLGAGAVVAAARLLRR